MEKDKNDKHKEQSADIFKLIDRFEESGLSRLKYCSGDMSLELERSAAAGVNAPEAGNKTYAEEKSFAAGDNGAVSSKSSQGSAEADGTKVQAPVAGIFYSAPKPGAPAYVKEGQQVKKGDVLGLIEAMKMMNEITAPVSGIVKKIHIKNEEFAEFKQVIMLID